MIWVLWIQLEVQKKKKKKSSKERPCSHLSRAVQCCKSQCECRVAWWVHTSYAHAFRVVKFRARPEGITHLVPVQGWGFCPWLGTWRLPVRCCWDCWSSHLPQQHHCRAEAVLPPCFWALCREPFMPSTVLLSTKIIYQTFWLCTMSLGIVSL